ncbi:Transcriptional regulator, TetR family [Pediococcus claussenii ATCC BAA-344]|uniref:Transcriptional regulator, TetR family n=2 Tax=Pediococcus claussenii TaxID=187452 RepID=G8PAX1_PEDCP|nr:Transcriptional regulator, TetR family [Pediococcus claussenii ATCC BAA-344]KRN20445.1 hypothetical protein IV79_GL000500 [Pediococcus claussenii]
MGALANLVKGGKDISDVSISQLVKKAKVSRSTFYRNFDNKEDFLSWVSVQLEEGILNASRVNFGDEVENPFQNYFNYLNQNRYLYTAFVNTISWPTLVDRMYLVATNSYERLLKGNKSNIPVKDLATYIVGAHVHVTRVWLLEDNPRSPEQMAELLTALTRDGLLAGLGIDSVINLPK